VELREELLKLARQKPRYALRLSAAACATGKTGLQGERKRVYRLYLEGLSVTLRIIWVLPHIW